MKKKNKEVSQKTDMRMFIFVAYVTIFTLFILQYMSKAVFVFLILTLIILITYEKKQG